MEKATLIHSMSPADLQACFNSLKKELITELMQNFKHKEPDENMTPNEVKEMLKCDRSTIHNLTVKGILKKYGCGGRIYYKRSEVESAIKPI